MITGRAGSAKSESSTPNQPYSKQIGRQTQTTREVGMDMNLVFCHRSDAPDGRIPVVLAATRFSAKNKVCRKCEQRSACRSAKKLEGKSGKFPRRESPSLRHPRFRSGPAVAVGR